MKKIFLNVRVVEQSRLPGEDVPILKKDEFKVEQKWKQLFSCSG